MSTIPKPLFAAAVVALTLAGSAGAARVRPPISAPLPRAGDVSLSRYVLVGRGRPKPALAGPRSAGVGVFTWLGRDRSNGARYDLLVAVVRAQGSTAAGPVGIALAGGGYRVTRTASVVDAIQPGRSLICNDVYDDRLPPSALARGPVRDPAFSVFGAVCALAADGPAPFEFVRSFGGFYCATQFVNDSTYLDGVRWATSCTKPFASVSLDVGPGYALKGSRLAEARCQPSGQTLNCSSGSEVTTIDLLLLLDPVPGDSPSGTVTVRRADGEQLAAVQVVQYPGAHQHG